jgi:dTMP kinase
MKGKLIVFEGTDSCGKKTQTKLLAERLRKMGKDVETIHFPTYNETPLGIFISKYLKGDFGSKESVTPEIASLFYSMDRYQLQKIIRDRLDEGVTIIADRYTPSNIFQVAKVKPEDRPKLWKWIKSLDERLPRPDAVIILNVPANVSEKLFSSRECKNDMLENKKDIHEEDMEYQEEVRKTYLEIAKRECWIVVECCSGENFRTIEEIHEEVYNMISLFF